MFASPTQILDLTGIDVDGDVMAFAQAIIESYVGRTEVEVSSPDDRMLLARAHAYQSAYMQANGSGLFEQVAFGSISQFGQSMTFRDGDEVSPFIAPYAVVACKNLSWRRLRSVRTGSIYSTPLPETRWETE